MRSKVITALVLLGLGLLLLLWPHSGELLWADEALPVQCGSALASEAGPMVSASDCGDVLLWPRVGGWTLSVLGFLLLIAPVRPPARPRAALPFLEPKTD